MNKPIMNLWNTPSVSYPIGARGIADEWYDDVFAKGARGRAKNQQCRYLIVKNYGIYPRS